MCALHNLFISYNGASWVRSKSLPVAYRTYDLNKGHKVVLARYKLEPLTPILKVTK
ncbi:MAG: hypothetical protein V4670_01215 [Bacteroidota bacterium]